MRYAVGKVKSDRKENKRRGNEERENVHRSRFRMERDAGKRSDIARSHPEKPRNIISKGRDL